MPQVSPLTQLSQLHTTISSMLDVTLPQERFPVERTLVSIQSIDALDPITGADNIEQARVMAEKLPLGFAIQGEVCGPGIQKNRLGLRDIELFVFNVYDIDAGTYLSFLEFEQFCYRYGLRTVPIERVVTGESAPGSRGNRTRAPSL